MKRRTFLHHTCHSLAIPGLVSSFGFTGSASVSSFLKYATETDRVLVLIYLQGGNDGLNTVIPLNQLSALNKVRPHVVLPENKLLKLDGASVGLHPSLKGFKSLYEEGRLEIIQSVGYPDQNYSHFRSTDIWMSGSHADILVNSGWAGRYLNHGHPGFPAGYPNEATPHPLSVEIGYGSSLLFQGPAAGMSMVLNDPASFYQLVENTEEDAPDTYAGEKLKHVRLIARQSQKYGLVVKDAAEKVKTQKPYPDDNELAQQLKVVAKMIAGGLKTSLYMVRLGGFDTHDSQVEPSDHTKGEHAELLTKLNDAVTAFMADLKFQGDDDRVIGLTFSEFGRRIVSNASNGTDHGSASPLFIFGNKVKGGVLGSNPVIPVDATYVNNLDMQYDFRKVYASVLDQWFGMPASDISGVLLSDFDTVPVIRGATTGIEKAAASKRNFNVYPNPFGEQATIEFISSGGHTYIEVIDVQGSKVDQIFNGTVLQGKHAIQWNTNLLPRGNFFIIIRSDGRMEIKSVVKR